MIFKFEEFKPEELKNPKLYLHNHKNSNHLKPFLADIDSVELNKFRDDVRNLKWTDLNFKDDLIHMVRFSLPEHLNAEASKLYVYNTTLELIIDHRNVINRVHTGGLHLYLRGLGLGYKMYKSIADYLGFISSEEDATKDAKNIWKYLIQDPHFYSLLTNNRVLIINKNKTKNDIKIIITNYLNSIYDLNIKDNIDSDVINKLKNDNVIIKMDNGLKNLLKEYGFNKMDIDLIDRLNRINKTPDVTKY